MEFIITVLFISVIVFGLGYQILSILFLRNEIKNKIDLLKTKFNKYPSISILKPLKGIDDQLENNLKSFFELDYPNFELIFGIQSHDDKAIDIVSALIGKYPKVKSKLTIDENMVGLNPKINNLYNIYPNVKCDFIFISDSNTAVNPNFLKLLIREFSDESIGLVTATIRGKGAKNIVSTMENLHLNTFVAPSVITASKLAHISIVIGKAILIPKILLEKIGRFESLKNYLAEDYWMGAKIEELGYKVKTSTIFVENVNENISLGKFLNRHSRWAKMRSKIKFSTYLLESLSNPISASFLFAIFLHSQIGIQQFILVSFLKSIIDYFSLKIMKSDIKFYQLLIIPIKDLLIGLLWYVPFFNTEVTWRNNSFKIQKDSILQPIL